MIDDFLVNHLLEEQKADQARIKELELELALWKKDTTKLVFALKALHAATGWKTTEDLLYWWEERSRT